MKTKNFFITSICLISGINNAWATGSPCTILVDCDSVTISGTANNIASCAGGNAGTTKCYRAENGKYYAVVDCIACNIGYSYETSDTVCPNIEYQACVSCDCHQICANSVKWESTGTEGYERGLTADANRPRCDCSTRKCLNAFSETAYRCAAGYYGSSTDGTSGCTMCPTWTGVYTNPARTILARGTNSAGNKNITSCYFRKGGTYYDNTGTFTLDSVCSYTN